MAGPKNFLKVLVKGTNPDIDIVAVHGLNPTNKDSHAEETWTADGKLWLRDFLSPELPTARILLFGYNSSVANGGNLMDIEDHAENLLNRLELKRNKDPGRPIIFITHSLGGLVVKKALVEAKVNDQYSTIRSATYGIVFFATPHLGGNYANFGDMLCNITNTVMCRPKNNLVKDLQKTSRYLLNLNDQFRHQLEDYFYVNFFESQHSKSIGGFDVIVDKSSARLGVPGQRERIIGRDADHTSICKFAVKDEDYEQVEDNIVALVSRARVNRGSPKTPPTPFNSAYPGYFPPRHLSSSTVSLDGSASVQGFENNTSTFQVPHNKARDFVGREELITRMISILTSSDEEQHKVALYGLGGVGKTEVAVQCAYTIQESWPDIYVFWVQANSFEQCHQSIVKIASALQIPGLDAPNADVLGSLRGHLQVPFGRWLLIIDQADDFQNLTFEQPDRGSYTSPQSKRLLDYIPDCNHGSILLTTRDRKIASRFTGRKGLEQVLPFNKQESKELVTRILSPSQCRHGGVEELTEVLSHFPLAIKQATSFILGNNITLRTYLQRYHEKEQNVLELFDHEYAGDANAGNAVTTTWMISFEQLQTRNQYAADLFSLMAFLDHNNIPEDLLHNVDDTKTPLQFEDACGDLKAFSFISEISSIPISASANTDDEPRTFSVQPIVQLVMRLWLEKQGQTQKWAEKALVAVYKAFPATESSKEHWKAHETYLPHVYVVLDHIPAATTEGNHKAALLHNLSWYLRVRGFHDTAEHMAQEALEIRRGTLGDEDEVTLSTVHGLSLILFEQGKTQEAEDLQVPALNVLEKRLGHKHRDVLTARRHLAAIRGSRGQYEDALKLQEEVVEMSENTMGQCPATWLAMRDLAITYNYVDRKAEAQELQLKVLAAREENLGSDHPETLIIMSDLAMTYVEQTKFEEAEVLLKNVLEQSKRVLGERHPHTIAAYREFKAVLQRQEKTEHIMRLEHIVARIQRGWKESEERSPVLGRPKPKRNMSSSVVTYTYRKNGTYTRPPDEHHDTTKEIGLGLELVRLETRTIDDDGEIEGESDGGLYTIRNAVLQMNQGLAVLPVLNMVSLASEGLEIEYTNRETLEQKSPNNNFVLETSADSPAHGQLQIQSHEASPNIQSPPATTLTRNTTYSSNKVVRSVEKKFERNVNKDTATALLKDGKDLIDSTKNKWKQKNFKDLLGQRKSGQQDEQA